MITNLMHAWGSNVWNTKFDPFPAAVHHRPYQTLAIFCLPPLGIEHTHQIELYLGLYYYLGTSSPAYPLERRAIRTITCSVHTLRRASFAQKHIDSGGLQYIMTNDLTVLEPPSTGPLHSHYLISKTYDLTLSKDMPFGDKVSASTA